jgi:hypothetical protein
VITAAHTGTGDHQHQVGSTIRLPDLGSYRVRVVELHVPDEGQGAGLTGSRGKQDRVAVNDVAPPGAGSGLTG